MKFFLFINVCDAGFNFRDDIGTMFRFSIWSVWMGSMIDRSLKSCRITSRKLRTFKGF
jgi:hypothetical protein